MLVSTNNILNYQFVSLQGNAVQERYYFPDLPNLRSAKVYRIVAYTSEQFTNDINNVPLVNQATFGSSYITINSNGLEVIQKLDLNMFKTIATADSYTNFNGSVDLFPMMIDFSKSYVQLSNGTGVTPTPPFVYAFGIYYVK